MLLGRGLVLQPEVVGTRSLAWLCSLPGARPAVNALIASEGLSLARAHLGMQRSGLPLCVMPELLILQPDFVMFMLAGLAAGSGRF
jgi:hypothetical protein